MFDSPSAESAGVFCIYTDTEDEEFLDQQTSCSSPTGLVTGVGGSSQGSDTKGEVGEGAECSRMPCVGIN